MALANSSGSNLAPGQYVMEVKAAAQGSGTADSSVNFGIDSSAPTLTVDNIGNSLVSLSAPYSLLGLAESLSGLSSLVVEESADGGATYTTAYSKTYAATTVSDNWSMPAGSLPLGGADGSYGYQITLTAASGLKAIIYRSVIYDHTPPTVGVTAPTPGSWTSASPVSLSGIASDGAGSGVGNVYYVIDSADHTAELASWSGPGAPSGSWTAASGIVSSWTGSSGGLAEGAHRLWVVASDKSGNHDRLALVDATSLAAGTTCTIDTIGTTDFTTVGAVSNTVGLTFTATGPGAGSGKVWTGNRPGCSVRRGPQRADDHRKRCWAPRHR